MSLKEYKQLTSLYTSLSSGLRLKYRLFGKLNKNFLPAADAISLLYDLLNETDIAFL